MPLEGSGSCDTRKRGKSSVQKKTFIFSKAYFPGVFEDYQNQFEQRSMGIRSKMRPGHVQRAGSDRERGEVAPSPFSLPDPARSAPALSIVPTDREPGTG